MLKVNVYLKSGQTISFKCKEITFEYKNDTLEYCGYKIEGIVGLKKLNFVPSQIAAYTIK